MLRARAHLIEHDLITVPSDERIDVIPTPEYLRNVLPFAAYFQPAAFDADPKGIYVVTPSVGHDPHAMLEHNYASISNTSIHEAYPGHHLQLDIARRHPSLTRLLTEAPEFVEGWGMYTELLMREHGFDDGPRFRLMLHTDAIWRACRIILDVRMHRGELTVDEATDFLVEQTGFQRSNARAEVEWYTYKPTYPLSYLLGRTLLLGLRADEQRRLGDAFSLKALPRHAHAQRLDPDQLPPATAGARPADRRGRHRTWGLSDTVQIIPSIDLERGRSRTVYWPGAAAGIGAPTDRPERIAERFSAMGAKVIHLVDFEGARNGTPGNLEAVGGIAARVGVPLQLAGGVDTADGIRLAFAAGATRVVLTTAIADRPDDLRECLSVAGDWLAVGLDPRPERLAAFRWHRADPPGSVDDLIGELVGAGVGRLVLSHGGTDAGPVAGRRSRSPVRCGRPDRRRGHRPRRHRPPARYRRGGPDPGRGPALGRHRLQDRHGDRRVITVPFRRLTLPLVALSLAAIFAGCTAAPGASTAPSTAPSAEAGACPTSQPDPLPAGETRTVTLTRSKGAIVIGIQADLSPIAAGNFVALAVVRLLRRVPVPPPRPGVRHPGRRPDRHRDGRTRLRDRGRAGHHDLPSRDRGHGPDRGAGLGRLAVLHRPDGRGRGVLASGQHLPDHRRGHVRDGRRRRHRSYAEQRPPSGNMALEPVIITTATVTNP